MAFPRFATRLSGATLAAAAVIGALALIEGYALIRHGTGPQQPPVSAALLGQQSAGAPAIGWVDAPAANAVVGTKVYVKGWALDPEGIAAVDVRLDGQRYPARIGIERSDVATAKPGLPDSARSGFEFTGDFTAELKGQPFGRHELAVVAINRSGQEKVLATKSLIPAVEDSPWRSLYRDRGMERSEPFFVLPAVSAVPFGGAAGLESTYTNYLSPTVKVGIRVPILYVRTTLGPDRDWEFDPNFDVKRKCGNTVVTEDSLAAYLDYSVKNKVPVLVTLNGGVWASAGCNTPEWDITDHLRLDPMNCQWNEHDQVMPKDYLRDLAGSIESPALSRMLTFNVYAGQNRHYKRRNLQAAGKVVAAFAREHPDLYVGVTLDADTYHNPFFEEKQWYDYNPGTLRQFREWLQGIGPYAGAGGPGVPDLRPYRRKHALTLAQVNKLAGRKWTSWSEVDPPRAFPREGKPFWEDAWTHEWEVYRRHLVDLHYDELSQWLADVGLSTKTIYSSQGFMGPHPAAMPFAERIESQSKNYDTGGMSVEGSIPVAGHLGAIVYGPGAENNIRMESPDSLFAVFHRLDPGWAVVEMNTADLRDPKALPTYATAYRSFVEMFNYGARFVSPMAWNGSNGLAAAEPGYVSYTAWRNTPLEQAMLDFAVSHAYVPLGTRLWTFGNPRVESTDGWGVDAGSMLKPGRGFLSIRSAAKSAVLVSPADLAVGREETDLLVLGLEPSGAATQISVDARDASGAWVPFNRGVAAAALQQTPAGLLVPLIWPASLVTAEQIRITIATADTATPMRLTRVALYPKAAPVRRGLTALTRKSGS